MLRPLYLVAGCLLVVLGVIGAFLPLMPSTIFLILAAWCFARSSPRLEQWLLDHSHFGPVLRAWQESRAIPRRAKIMALCGMALGFAAFWFGAHPAPWLLVLAGLAILACAVFVASRPEPTGRG